MALVERKSPRLIHYDYSSSGGYFVTFCTHNRDCLLGTVVGEGFHALPHVALSDFGLEVKKSIEYTNEKYSCIDKYIIMPNHVHIIFLLRGADRHGNLSLQDLVGRIKSFSRLQYTKDNKSEPSKVWQRSFHDHIIRNEQKYLKIWNYIDSNTAKWLDDCYYVP